MTDTYPYQPDGEAERAAIRRGLWTVIDALGIRDHVQPRRAMLDLVAAVEESDLTLHEALVLGVFLTNAAEQQMTAAVELASE